MIRLKEIYCWKHRCTLWREINAFTSKIFPLQPTEGSGSSGMSDCLANLSDCLHHKILTPK